MYAMKLAKPAHVQPIPHDVLKHRSCGRQTTLPPPSLLSLFPRRVASVPVGLLFCSMKLAFSSILLFLDEPPRLLSRFVSGALGDFACLLGGASGCSEVSRFHDLLACCPSLDLGWVVCTQFLSDGNVLASMSSDGTEAGARL